MDNFRFLFPDEAFAGTNGIFSLYGSLDGTMQTPEFKTKVALRDGSLSGIPVDSVTLNIDYDHLESRLVLNSSVISEGQKAANLNAHIPFSINTRTFEINLPRENDSVLVDIETNDFDLMALNDFLSEFSLRAEGRLDGNLAISGTRENPIPDGSFELKNGAIQHSQTGLGIEDVQSTIMFQPDQVILNNFTVKGGKGKLIASGKIQLQESLPGDIEIQVKADNYRAVNTPDQNAVINMNALIRGTLSKPEISGKMDFVSGYLMLHNFGEESEKIEEIKLDSLEKDRVSLSIIDSLSLDFDVEFDRRFYIRNDVSPNLEIELDGELELLKEVGKDLQLFGTMNSTGYIRPLGKRFELKEGSVNFLGNPMNPELEIRAEYEPPKAEEYVIISYVIEGTLEEPIFTFESDPQMELEQIVSYTLFGEPFQVSDVALNILSSRIEQLAAQQLSIDYVKIETQRSGGESGTSITTGWYLNQKTFFAIQNIVTGSTQDSNFLLEYLLKRNLKIIILQGNNVNQGAYLQWNYDY
jgi:autotransporter translocation and assembly factor TamB